MEKLIEYLPFLLPLIIIQLALAAVALIHALRHHEYRFGNRVIWIIIILFVNFVGPIIYLTLGRAEDPGENDKDD